MNLEATCVLGGMAVGVGATLIMDLWNLFLKRAFNVSSLNYCYLGRWLRHMPEGTFRHTSIAAAPPKPFECAVGWMAHYTIGIGFALVLVVLAPGWLERPTLLPGQGVRRKVGRSVVVRPGLGRHRMRRDRDRVTQ